MAIKWIDRVREAWPKLERLGKCSLIMQIGEKCNAYWRRDLQSQIPMQARQMFFFMTKYLAREVSVWERDN